MSDAAAMPDWAEWNGPHELGPWTVGVEEEVMLLDPASWALAHRAETVLPRIPPDLNHQIAPETHGSAVELQTGIHADAGEAAEELSSLRRHLEATLRPLSLRAATSGTHPFAIWQEIVVSSGERYQFVYGSMRELARREPTFALHVHVGIPDPDTAIRVANRLRAHVPMLLALSANSPFWQGRDTGLASARTPLFQAFPRVGIPQVFQGYEHYVETVDLLIRSRAIPDPTFLWWDVRPQARFGTVEVRIMDVQTRAEHTGALTALVQCLARLEGTEGFVSEAFVEAHEVISENRFLAARDGAHAELIEPDLEQRIPLKNLLEDVIVACRPHAQDLGCEGELELVREICAAGGGAADQIAVARRTRTLASLVQALADDFGISPEPRSMSKRRQDRTGSE